MSLSGLNQQYIPNTLDGLNVIEADQIYIDGQLVDLTDYVPYQGASRTIDAGGQNIQTTHTATASNDVVNKGLLDTTISNLSIAIAGSFLDKVSLSSQSVLGPVTYTAQLTANNFLVPESKEADLGGSVQVSANYRRTETDATVTANYRFGSISSSLGVYQATTTGDFATLGLATVTVGKRYSLTVNLLGSLPSYNCSLQLYASSDGQSPSQALGASVSFTPGSTIFQVLSQTSFIPQYQYIILLCVNSAPGGSGLTVKWYGLEVYETGVELEKVTMPLLTASQIPILNDKKQLVGSGVSSSKVQYLDNCSEDIQSALNNRLKLDGSNANQDIYLGGYKVQSTATPTANADYTTKLYVDNAISGAGSLYVTKAGDNTLTGNMTFTNTATNAGVMAERFYLGGRGDNQDGTGTDTDGPWYGLGKSGIAGFTGVPCLAGYYGCALRSASGSLVLTEIGGVGIGTTDPSTYKLRVNGTSLFDGNVSLGANAITSTTNPTTADQLTRKGYVDTQLALYLPLTGGTLSGSLAVGANAITCTRTPVSADDVTRKGYVDTQDSLKANLSGGNTWYGGQYFNDVVASRVAIFDASKNLTNSSVTTTTLSYLDATSSIQGQLNTLSGTFASYLPLTGGTVSGTITTNALNLSGQIASRVLILDGSKNAVSSSVTSTTLSYLDIGSSLTGLLNTKVNLSGNQSILGTLTLYGLILPVLPNRAIVSDGTNSLVNSVTTATELSYLSGCTSSVQNQIDTKASTSYVNTQDTLRVAKSGDVMSGSLGINTGANTVDTDLYVYGKGKFYNDTYTAPGNGVNGSDGARIILWPGSSTSAPYAFGINSSTLWYGTPTGASHKWYGGTTNTMILNDAGNLSILGGLTAGSSNFTGQLSSGISGAFANTTPNILFANSACHIDNSAGQVYLFTAQNGYVSVGRNTTRNATTANLLLGVASTDESEIISRNTDNTAYLPLNFAGSVYTFVAGNSTAIDTPSYTLQGQRGFDGSNFVNLQCQASQYGRNQLILTGRYELANDAWSFLSARNAIRFRTQSSLNSTYTNRWTIQNFSDRLGFLSVTGGDVPRMVLRDEGYVGIGTTNPIFNLDVLGQIRAYTSTGDYSNILSYCAGTGDKYASFNCRANSGGGSYWFQNSSTRTSDGGANCCTLRNDVGPLRLQSGTETRGIYISNNGLVSIGKHDGNSDGILNIWNPNGTASHFGWTNNGNYIRGAFTQIDTNVNIGQGDTSMCLYGPNSTWNSYLRVGAGTSSFNATTAQVISTNGNLHADAGYGKDIYIGYYQNQANSLGTTYSYGPWRHNSNKFIFGNVGIGTDSTSQTYSPPTVGKTFNVDGYVNGLYFYTSGSLGTGSYQGYIQFVNGGHYIANINPGGTGHVLAFNSGKYTFNGLSAGTVAVDGSGYLYTYSDRRVKNSIQYFDETQETYLDKVLRLKPCSFKLNQDPFNTKIGFIAQDVEEIIPDAVDGKKHEWRIKINKETGEAVLDENGQVTYDVDEMTGEKIPRYRGLDTTAILAHSVKAIQELHYIITSEQQKQIDTLIQRNQLLEAWARDSEAKQKKMEERMEKMASLIAQLLQK